MPIDPGRLNRRATIQVRTTTIGASGGVAVSYTTAATVWAQKVEMRGNESRIAGATRAEVNLILRIRYLAGISEQHRVVFDGRTYDVLAVFEEGNREFNRIEAKFTEGSA